MEENMTYSLSGDGSSFTTILHVTTFPVRRQRRLSGTRHVAFEHGSQSVLQHYRIITRNIHFPENIGIGKQLRSSLSFSQQQQSRVIIRSVADCWKCHGVSLRPVENTRKSVVFDCPAEVILKHRTSLMIIGLSSDTITSALKVHKRTSKLFQMRG